MELIFWCKFILFWDRLCSRSFSASVCVGSFIGGILGGDEGAEKGEEIASKIFTGADLVVGLLSAEGLGKIGKAFSEADNLADGIKNFAKIKVDDLTKGLSKLKEEFSLDGVAKAFSNGISEA